MFSDFARLGGGFVLFIGPGAAGKTSILRRLVTGKFETQDPTLGFFEEKIAQVRIIEIGGQKSIRDYWKAALDEEPIHIFFVVDITKDPDYQEYKEFTKDINIRYPKLKDKITLTANKVDLTDSIPKHIDEDKYFFICSAKTGEGMLDILETIASYKGKS